MYCYICKKNSVKISNYGGYTEPPESHYFCSNCGFSIYHCMNHLDHLGFEIKQSKYQNTSVVLTSGKIIRSFLKFYSNKYGITLAESEDNLLSKVYLISCSISEKGLDEFRKDILEFLSLKGITVDDIVEYRKKTLDTVKKIKEKNIQKLKNQQECWENNQYTNEELDILEKVKKSVEKQNKKYFSNHIVEMKNGTIVFNKEKKLKYLDTKRKQYQQAYKNKECIDFLGSLNCYKCNKSVIGLEIIKVKQYNKTMDKVVEYNEVVNEKVPQITGCPHCSCSFVE